MESVSKGEEFSFVASTRHVGMKPKSRVVISGIPRGGYYLRSHLVLVRHIDAHVAHTRRLVGLACGTNPRLLIASRNSGGRVKKIGPPYIP